MNTTPRGTYHITPQDGPRRSTAERKGLARDLGKILGEGTVLWRDGEILTYDADGLVYEKFWPDLVALPTTTEEVRQILRASADDDPQNPGWDPNFGHGRLNARSALSLLKAGHGVSVCHIS